MGLNFTQLRMAKGILDNIYDKDINLNHQQVLSFLEEFLENGENYIGQYTKAPHRSTSESRKIFNAFVEYCLYRNLANYDSMILLTSDKGTGKSSFAMMLAREWCKLIGIKFNPDRHMAYSNQQVMDKIQNLKPFEPLICDEAIRFASSEDWNKSENKELKKVLGQVRTKHLFYILCFPLKLMKLDKTYLESYVNYWVDLFGRGIGALYVKDKNPYYDAWRIKEFQKLGSYTEFTRIPKIKQALSKHPNFWYIIKCPKPPPRLYAKYLKVREYNIYDDNNIMSTINKADVIRAVLIVTLKEILQRDSSLSNKRLLIHLENTYGIKIDKKVYDMIVQDAMMLTTKVKEEKLGKYIK